MFKQKLCDSRFPYWVISKQRLWFEVDVSDVTMQILTSFDAEQKRVTQILRISKMSALEQRSAIKFCVANKKSRQETFEMIKTAFENNAMKKTALYKSWYSKFEQGDNSVTGEPRPGRPHPSQQRKLKQPKSCWTLIVGWLLDSDLRMSIRDITIRTGTTFGTVFRIIHNELGMRRIEIDTANDWWK